VTAPVATFRIIIGALALLWVAVSSYPVAAQQPTSVNPTKSAVNEQQLLQQLQRIQGRGSIPDTKSYTIEQPAGRDWRHFHEVTLRWVGAIAILGVLGLLVMFYLVRGMVRIGSGRSGQTILRFNAAERFVHWMTAICFIILALSGLNITFGKPLLLPLMSPEAFTAWSQWAKYAHNYLSFPFTLGVILIFFMWIAGNIPNRVDIEWFRRGGGMIGHDHPPAYRFNGGQKLIYWIVVLGGSAIAVSGYLLMFPFYGTDIQTMQNAEMAHGVIAMLFIAAMLGHIYIGTIGMEGAFEAMGEGTVDINWAKEHHELWLEYDARARSNQLRTQPAALGPRAASRVWFSATATKIGSAPVLLSSWMFSVACRIGTVYPSSLNRVLTAAASSGVHARISIISRLQHQGACRAGPPPPDGYRWPNLASSAKRYRPLTKPKHRSSTVGGSGVNAMKMLTPPR
jgi:formate dehydrogenase subunit gamma